MRHVLVGTDGSDGAAAAVSWAAELAAATGAELTVATGFVPVESELPPQLVERRTAEAADRLEQWARPAQRPGLSVHTVVEQGDPRSALVDLAARSGADLLVIGRVGSSGGPGPLHLSSVPEYLVHHADLPLAVVGGSGALPRRVMVAVDGSANSLAALEWAAAVAAASSAALVAVSVEPLPEITATVRAGWDDDLLEQLRGWTAGVDAGTGIELVARNGVNVADVLVDTAAEQRADMVVLGMRGTGGFTGLRLGSAASRVLHRVEQPLVLIPAAD